MKVNAGITSTRGDMNEQNVVSEKLLNVCKEICLNYEHLQNELSSISAVLDLVERYIIAYSEEHLVKMHLKADKVLLTPKVLRKLANELENIKAGTKYEFLQGIDFLNIVEEILKNKERCESAVFVWKAKKALKYIIYEIDRINNAENPTKKIAILKGMIAYY